MMGERREGREGRDLVSRLLRYWELFFAGESNGGNIYL